MAIFHKARRMSNATSLTPQGFFRAKWKSMLESAVHPPGKVRSFKDMSESEKERMRKLYGGTNANDSASDAK